MNIFTCSKHPGEVVKCQGLLMLSSPAVLRRMTDQFGHGDDPQIDFLGFRNLIRGRKPVSGCRVTAQRLSQTPGRDGRGQLQCQLNSPHQRPDGGHQVQMPERRTRDGERADRDHRIARPQVHRRQQIQEPAQRQDEERDRSRDKKPSTCGLAQQETQNQWPDQSPARPPAGCLKSGYHAQ